MNWQTARNLEHKQIMSTVDLIDKIQRHIQVYGRNSQAAYYQKWIKNLKAQSTPMEWKHYRNWLGID